MSETPTPVPEVAAEPGLRPDEKTFAMLSHLLALSGFAFTPLGFLAGPLAIWLLKKDRSKFVDAHGKESVNFQITMTVAAIVSVPLCFLLIGIPILAAIAVLEVVLVVSAAVKAGDGEAYRYPLSVRFIK